MGEFVRELWGLIGLVMDVIRGGVKLDSNKSGDGFYLRYQEISSFSGYQQRISGP